ncbi:MAG: type I-E CRISPR-associated endoribonuclease Cas2e [Anaeromyxobacter sp.]
MAMTLVVTRDVAARYRGFLASCMLEVAAGVYTAPDMTRAVRERVWKVLEDWHAAEATGVVIMTWPDASAPGGQSMMFLGEPPKDFWVMDGLVVVRRELPAEPSTNSEK